MNNTELNQEAVFDLIRLKPETLVRRWGFEAEHPLVEQVRNASSYGEKCKFEFVHDPSVDAENDGCECDCRDCTYHECNCDYCDSYNDDPDHCGDCQAVNELCTSEPVPTAWNPDFEPLLRRGVRFEQDHFESGHRWGDPTGERWGGHIHVEARDLTRRQILTALAVSDIVFRLAPEWVIGWEDTYNQNKITEKAKADFLSGVGRWGMPRDVAVSATNVAGVDLPQPYEFGDTSWGKTTLEFRLFRTTFDPELIQIRGALARAIVNYAKRNEFGLYWVARCKTFEQVLEELGFGHH